MIYCIKCGKDLPNDANFCMRCGTALRREARTWMRDEPIWEIARTRCKVLKKERFSRICSCALILEAIGPSGTYVADQSRPFDYYFGYDPLAHGSGFVLINENRTTRAVFVDFVAKIVAAGWEPVPVQDSWYQCHFRRLIVPPVALAPAN